MHRLQTLRLGMHTCFTDSSDANLDPRLQQPLSCSPPSCSRRASPALVAGSLLPQRASLSEGTLPWQAAVSRQPSERKAGHFPTRLLIPLPGRPPHLAELLAHENCLQMPSTPASGLYQATSPLPWAAKGPSLCLPQAPPLLHRASQAPFPPRPGVLL